MWEGTPQGCEYQEMGVHGDSFGDWLPQVILFWNWSFSSIIGKPSNETTLKHFYLQKCSIYRRAENKLCLLNICSHHHNLRKNNLFLSWVTFTMLFFFKLYFKKLNYTLNLRTIDKFSFYRIESLEEEIISKGVKLVIIDSVASVVRKEFDTQLQGNMRERNKFLAREAASLKYLAEEFSIPVSFSFSLFPLYFLFSPFMLSSLTFNIK